MINLHVSGRAHIEEQLGCSSDNLSYLWPVMATALSSLLSQTVLDDHEEILKAANEALKRSKSDVSAQHTRVVALLKLDRFEDALRTFEDGGPPLKKGAQLEYAYALYKNGRYEAAEATTAGGGARRSLQHVEAQAAYRQEKFTRARQLYTKLASQRSDEENDLLINSGATDAQLCWSGMFHLASKTKAERVDMEQFETAFNAACGYIGRGQFKQALTLLRKANGHCSSLLTVMSPSSLTIPRSL